MLVFVVPGRGTQQDLNYRQITIIGGPGMHRIIANSVPYNDMGCWQARSRVKKFRSEG